MRLESHDIGFSWPFFVVVVVVVAWLLLLLLLLLLCLMGIARFFVTLLLFGVNSWKCKDIEVRIYLPHKCIHLLP